MNEVVSVWCYQIALTDCWSEKEGNERDKRRSGKQMTCLSCSKEREHQRSICLFHFLLFFSIWNCQFVCSLIFSSIQFDVHSSLESQQLQLGKSDEISFNFNKECLFSFSFFQRMIMLNIEEWTKIFNYWLWNVVDNDHFNKWKKKEITIKIKIMWI